MEFVLPLSSRPLSHLLHLKAPLPEGSLHIWYGIPWCCPTPRLPFHRRSWSGLNFLLTRPQLICPSASLQYVQLPSAPRCDPPVTRSPVSSEHLQSLLTGVWKVCARRKHQLLRGLTSACPLFNKRLLRELHLASETLTSW